MPVLTSAGSDSDSSQLSGRLHGGQSVFSRSSLLLLICTLTAAIAALYILQKLVLPRFSAPRPGHYISGNSCPPRGSASWISSDSKKPDLTSSWAKARQGQGHFEKQASWTISRGAASGTAPVGLGGPVEGSSLIRSMEQEEKTTHTGSKESRGVSNDSSYGAGQESSSLPHPDLPPFPAAAEESGHVRTSSSFHHPPPLGGVGDELSGPAEQETDSMDGDFVERQWGYGGLMTTSRSTAPFFGHPYGVADDLGVTYYPDGGFNAPSVVGRGGLPAQQHLELDTTRQPQSRPTNRTTSSSQRGRQTSFENRVPVARYAQSTTPTELEAVAIDSPGSGYYPGQTPGYIMDGTSLITEHSGEGSQAGSSHYSLSSGSSTRRSSTRNISIPAGADGPSSAGLMEGYHGRSPRSHTSFSPSSYPPASPLLPPPPISDYPFDPAAVMFPGPGAVDGGVRVVYMDQDHDHDRGHGHSHEDSGHGEAAGAFGGGSSWTRHTRVYGGGGVCLACAAAGGGGFYGARVRPEDKR